ncbi:hypothetical protein [Niabella ginsengisoli]|uniref:Uncharacterized protein n=1 Tax=Niabella ginsengisoli TaxID=522298 RepID=A0ABS9SP56_9BACT|nr:hypothetical protein [Niabella ginsengisoli]MCH5600138.1 hypothetical protein [Niabella ginsengisoli]
METIVLDKKTFVVIEKEAYEKIELIAAQKVPKSKKLSLAEGKKRAHKLIDKWAKEKSQY